MRTPGTILAYLENLTFSVLLSLLSLFIIQHVFKEYILWSELYT